MAQMRFQRYLFGARDVKEEEGGPRLKFGQETFSFSRFFLLHKKENCERKKLEESRKKLETHFPISNFSFLRFLVEGNVRSETV
jgi:hypothetical protein